MFQSNPHLEPENEEYKVIDARKGWLDVQFLVDAKIFDQVLGTLKEALRLE